MEVPGTTGSRLATTLSTSDVVETATFETETWLKLRDKNFKIYGY